MDEYLIPVSMASDEALIRELSRRGWSVTVSPIKMPEAKPKDWVKLGCSPSTPVTEIVAHEQESTQAD